MKILKFQQFESSREEVDPFGEETWEDYINAGFFIFKFVGDNGTLYMGAYDSGNREQRGIFRIDNTKIGRHLLVIGDVFEHGFSFDAFPMPDWANSPMTENDKERIYNDEQTIFVLHYDGKDFDEKYLTLTEISNIFNIPKEEINLEPKD